VAAKQYIQAARADSTVRAYEADWKNFSSWCEEHQLASLPADPHTIALYLSALAQSGRKAGTISRRITTIGLLHKRNRLASPCDNIIVRETLQGIRRSIGTRQRGKEPASLELIRKAIAKAEGTLAASRDRAILLVGFAGGLRRSELAAMRIGDLQWHKKGITI